MLKSFLAAVLLSVSVDRFGVSHMRDLKKNHINKLGVQNKIYLSVNVINHTTTLYLQTLLYQNMKKKTNLYTSTLGTHKVYSLCCT